MEDIKKCPFCGSDNTIPYLYGEPTYEAATSGKYKIGGCIIDGNNPLYYCNNCNRDIHASDEKELLFDVFHGGYFGPSYYYFIDRIGDNYYFKYAYRKDGSLVRHDFNNDEKYQSIKEKNLMEYSIFIIKVKEIISKWNDKYDNNDIMDGTQWHIEIPEFEVKKYGSNEFPNTYNEFIKILNDTFNDGKID